MEPFYEAISSFGPHFAVPVFYGRPNPTGPAALAYNGTGTQVRLGSRYLGVTCHHVLKHFREVGKPSGAVFHFGKVELDPDSYLLSEDEGRDLAVIDLTDFVDRSPDLSSSSFYLPRGWPPNPVSTDDVLAITGFPGIWRENPSPQYFRFYTFSYAAAEVVEASRDLIVSTIQIQECIVQIKANKVYGSLGGLSGGPVFVWRKTPILVVELVGFVLAYQEANDVLLIRSATVVTDEGLIV